VIARRSDRIGVGITRVVLGRALPMLLIPLGTPGWAQISTEPESGQPDGTVAIILIAATGLLLVLALVEKILELRLKRDGEAVAVRGLMSEALEREPSLLGLSITIVRVRVPLWTGSPVTVRVGGRVPSDQVRRAALQSMRQAAKANLIVGVRIKSRIGVARSTPAPGLGTLVRVFRRIRTRPAPAPSSVSDRP
jgi:hypothetical protein